MKNFEILLNNRYTATTQVINSDLQLQNDYYAYVNKNGGGIVNQYNVRGYLNDERNLQITNDFFAYLTGSTTQDQAINILTSDKKLADTFNDYYQRVIVSATSITSTAVIDQNLTGANQIVAYRYDHPWYGYAPSKQLTGITQDIYGSVNAIQSSLYWEDFTTEQSYYIPVYLERGTNQLSRYKYDACDTFINAKTAGFFPQYSGITSSYFGLENISNVVADADSVSLSFLSNVNTIASTADTRIHTLIDCFVDLNLETNENTGAPPPLPLVSFEFPTYNVDEGNTLPILVKLNTPSVLGIEQATIDLITPTINPAILGSDYTASQTYPVTLSWSAGEQNKFLNFTASNDYFLEPTENYLLQISSIVNLDPGTYLNTTVNIADKTVLRTASLSVAPPASLLTIFGVQLVVVPEGDFVDLTVNLDGPAFGVESVALKIVSTATTLFGTTTVGPSANPATFGTDYTVSASTVVFSFAPGETQKTYRFSAKTDVIIETFEGTIFELQNPQFCLIDQTKNVINVSIQDTTGGYKYVHLNLGNIYSEFGNSQQNTLMRQINPQPSFFSSYANIYANQYAHNLIQYGSTINWADYVGTAAYNSDTYSTSLVKVKVTNLGVIQTIVNGVTLNAGQSTTISVTGNDFILTATTNTNKNTITNLYDYANYKVELINNYSGKTIPLISSSYSQPVQFAMRTTGNTLSTNNTINLGNYLLSGMTTNPANTAGQYRLKSKYKNVNTGRPNTGTYYSPVYTCPPVSSFFYSISFSEFYAVDIENISILGIIFLNYNQYANYTNNTMSTYDSFDFISAASASTFTTTCSQTNSQYNGLDYISIPFRLEP